MKGGGGGGGRERGREGKYNYTMSVHTSFCSELNPREDFTFSLPIRASPSPPSAPSWCLLSPGEKRSVSPVKEAASGVEERKASFADEDT